MLIYFLGCTIPSVQSEVFGIIRDSASKGGTALPEVRADAPQSNPRATASAGLTSNVHGCGGYQEEGRVVRQCWGL